MMKQWLVIPSHCVVLWQQKSLASRRRMTSRRQHYVQNSKQTLCSKQIYLVSYCVDINFNTWPVYTSGDSKSSTHYLSDTNRFDVSSKGRSSGISVRSRVGVKLGLG